MNTSEDLYKYREDYGGYIILNDDCIKYHISKNESPKDINLYNDYEIYKYKVIGTYNDSKGNIVNIEIESMTDSESYYRYQVSTVINGEKVSVPLTQDGVPPYRHMIPVPQENATYYLELYGKVNKSYKLDEKGEKICLIGKSEPVYIGNGTVMELYYNDVPYSTEIEPHLTDVEKELDSEFNNFGNETLKYLITGWWNNQYEGNDKAAWEDDDVHQDIMWKIKEALYMSHINDKTKPHKINIKVTGGIPPYDEILLGSNNAGESLRIWDYNTSKPVLVNNLFELTNIQVPSLNYYYKGHKRRSNFIYWAEDYYYNYVGGNNGFVFPIIYKPFFTEMLLCNYSKKGVYLCGNVYNGKTWLNSLNEYEFNVFSFNGQNLGSISTNISDTKFKLNEITDNGEIVKGEGVCELWDDEKAKEYCKYNGRKITVIRPLTTLDVYNVFINNNYLNGSLKIGTNLKYEENDYIDEISISNNSLALFNFDTDYKIENNELQIRKIINSSNANVYIVKDKDYPYPMNEYGEPTITNTKLFRNIVNNSINSLSYDKNEYIDLSKCDDDSNLYWIALPDRKGDIITSINDNILKSVTISELVNVKELKSFYPLDLNKNTCTTILKSNGTYETKMELRCEDTISKSNMSGKEFTITFYKEESGKNKIHEITLTPNSSMISYKFTTNDRELLGIENNDKEKVLYFNYNTKIIESNTVCPIPYGMRKMVVKFEIEEEI